MNKSDISVIPLPAVGSVNDKGRFVIDRHTVIAAPAYLEKSALYLKEKLAGDISMELNCLIFDPEDNEAVPENSMVLEIDDGSGINDSNNLCLNDKDGKDSREKYFLKIDQKGVLIKSTGGTGIIRGIQTLRQMLPVAAKKESNDCHNGVSVPYAEIMDFPRYGWRGFMLDVARHFYGVDAVKQIIDAMALLKMNILHLHLCDDQGWRIQIDKYPLLTGTGSYRAESQSGGFLGRKGDGMAYGGYYTKEDIRDIVDYAARSYITVVPEIEMPGHCSASLASYPVLGCRGNGYSVATRSGIKKDIYCAGKDYTYEFLEYVLDEVIELFPSRWIHLGGDEAPVTRWKSCPACQEKIKRECLGDEKGLQRYFMGKMIGYIESKGRVAITWNDLLWEKTPLNSVIQYWLRGEKEVMDFLNKGGSVIASHFFHTYLDYNHGVLPLSKIYSYDPFSKRLSRQCSDNILGLESPLWTESAKTLEQVHVFIFPRLVALAENGWTMAYRKDFSSFLNRLPVLLKRLRFMGISHTAISDSNPRLLKRLKLWTEIHRQSSVLPGKIIKAGEAEDRREI